jgi:hypothetical protein
MTWTSSPTLTTCHCSSCTRRWRCQLVIAALTTSVENAAEVTLQAVDDRRQALGIYKVKVSLPTKALSRRFELSEPV